MSAERVDRIRTLAAGWVDQGITPSLVVLAVRRGIVVLHEAFGRAGPEPDASPLQRDAIFPLDSISKPITATAVMCLVDDGLLGLNRPVSEYIPEFTGEGKDAVMIHHLLTHTSGLRDEDLEAHAEAKRASMAIAPPEDTEHPRTKESLCLIYDAPLWKSPGEEMSYCGYGFQLLGEIVRRVSGQSLDALAHERIFRPLGMDDTTYIVPDALRSRIVRHAPDPSGVDWWARVEEDTPWPDRGVYSTAMDMAVFGQMFLNAGSYGDARVLSPASVREMTRNQIPGISARFFNQFFPEAEWGLGWGTHGRNNAPGFPSLCSDSAFGHGGGFGVYMWGDPDNAIVGAYFSAVIAEFGPDTAPVWCGDLFANAVTASVVDP